MSASNPAPKRRGVVGHRDGLPCVAFERHLAHSVEKVWAAIAEPEQRAAWVPGIQFEPKRGAPFDIWFGDECDGPSHASGTIEACEPLRLLQVGSIRFELTPSEAGGSGKAGGTGGAAGIGQERCLLRFSDVLWYDNKRAKRQFANAVLAGWHQYLDRLELWLDEGRVALRLPEPDYSSIDVPGREDV